MKKYSLFAVLLLLLVAHCGFAQGPTLLMHADFENGLPAGWTVSSNSNITINSTLAATGEKSVRMQPTTGEIILTSPAFQITPGCATRLEFSHIPILNNENGGRVEVKKPNGTWATLTLQNAANPSCYDPSYGAGLSNFTGSFRKVNYWTNGNVNIPVEDLDSSYWRNEIFYLYSTLTAAASEVQIRFVIPASPGAAANFSGWFLDDIRLFVASVAGDEVRVPQIRNIVKAPNMANYPTCSDILVEMQIRDAGGAMSTAPDAVKIEYMQADENGNFVSHTTNMTLINATTYTYEGYIPFNGFGKVTYWRVLATDSKGNQIRYPFVYDTYNKYTIIRPFEGAKKISETQTSNQELMIPTNKAGALFQMRYSAEELNGAGITAGEIAGLYYNVTQAAAGIVLPDFNLSIGNVSPNWILDEGVMYSETALTLAYNNPTFVSPPVGEHYIEFNEPFLWDGVSDIMIKICWGLNETTGGVTKVECIPTANNYRTGQNTLMPGSFQMPCTSTFGSGTSGMSNYKVNFKFNFAENCILPVDVALSDKLAVPADQKVISNTNATFGVYLRNDGSEPLTQAKVTYLSDDGNTGNATWTGNLAPDDSTVFNVTTSMSLTPGFRKVTAWTDILPPEIDWNTNNDTVTYEIVSCDGAMNGVYAVGDVQGVAASRTFEDFRQIFKYIEVCGVGAPVTVKIDMGEDGVCSDILKFPANVQGASATNTITFTSANPDAPVKFYVNSAVNGNTSTFDLSGCKFLKFDNFIFLPAMSYVDNDGVALAERYVVKMSQQSSNIEFNRCQFPVSVAYGTPQVQSSFTVAPTALLELSAANNIVIDSCTFDNVASKVINIKGQSPTSMSSGVSITNSTFNYNAVTIAGNQTVSDYVIYAEYNNGLTISQNIFNSSSERPTVGGEKYAVMLQSSKNFNVNKNTFNLEKITAIAISQTIQSDSKIVNNMISVNNSNTGVGNIHLSAIKFLSGQGLTIAYNNIYVVDAGAPGKQATGLNLGSQGQTSSGVLVQNNIVVSSGTGYGIWAKPSTDNFAQSFILSNNMYYKMTDNGDNPLFRINTGNIASSASWEAMSDEENSHYTENPFFAAWNDLISTSTFLCEKGIAVTGITDDFFARPRPTTAPCIGALEFAPPTNNIYVVSATLNNGTYEETADGTAMFSSCAFGDETISVTFKNISSNIIAANTVRMYYKVNNSTPVNGGLVTHAIEPNVDYVFQFNQTYDFTSTATDITRDLKVYSSLAADTVNTNDTVLVKILSKHQLPAPANQTINVDYGDIATLTVNSNDSIYWYKEADDFDAFLKAQTLVTSELYADTVFYFSAKEEIPLVKITELQFSRTATMEQGITSPLPSWITTANAYEISNLGNGNLDMTGYKFMYYTGTNGTLTNNAAKTYNFEDGFVLPANSSIVLLPVSPNSVTQEGVIGFGTGTVAANKQAGFVIRNAEGTVIDAVAVNGANFATAHNVPASVWQGASDNLTLTNTAGIVRNTGTTGTQADWTIADAAYPMSIGTYNSDLTVHADNGCQGAKATFTVNIQNAPEYNPGIVEVSLVGIEADSSCTLGLEQVKVKIANMGLQPISNIPINYFSKNNGIVVEQASDTYTGTINPFDTVEYVLAQPLAFYAQTTDQTYEVFACAVLATDLIHDNDTASMEIVSITTPLAPTVVDVSIPYASSTTLNATSQYSLIWYESEDSQQELSRGTYETPVLYETDTFYVAALLETPASKIFGDGTTTNTSDGAPTPFAYSRKQVKEQYLWTAEDLSSLGEGVINSLGFMVKTEVANVTMYDYTIKIGTTEVTDLSSWISGLQAVYTDSVTITKTPAMIDVWVDMDFHTPFYYDGVSNLVVEISYNTPSTGGKVRTYNSTTDYTSTIVFHSQTENAAQYTGEPSATYSKRPNVQFGITNYGCKSERAALIVNVATPPSCEAALTEVVAPEENEIVMSGIPTPVQVELKNYGLAPLTTVELHWSINGEEQTVYNWTGSLAQNATETVTVGTYTFSSGVVEVKAWLTLECDTEHTNDTVFTSFSSCIGNNTSVTTVNVGSEATDDYADLTSFMSDLTLSGICGPIEVHLAQGTYDEQITMPAIPGLSETNYIKFIGQSEDNTQTIITFTPGAEATEKHIISLSDVENIHFENLTLQCTDTTAASAIVASNVTNISFNEVNFVSPKTMTSQMLSIEKGNQINISANRFNGSAFQLRLSECGEQITINNNEFLDFGISAIAANISENTTITNNYLSTDTSKYAVVAMNLNSLSGATTITANRIYLKKGSAVRTGMLLRNIAGTQFQPTLIANNAISMIGSRTSSSALAYVGIDIDYADWLNVYYNTVYLEPSKGTNTNSKCLSILENGSNIMVQNNNLDNSGKGYAMYVKGPATQVVLSNNNNYYTTGNKFVYWVSDKADLQLLRTANSMDVQSVSVANTFENDSTLALTFPTDIVRVAEPIDDVSMDIVGNFRPVSPKPTIGAYEYQFAGDDTGIPRIIQPIEGDEYIEGDPLTVEVEIKNFGNYSITNVELTAVLKASLDSQTPIQTITENWTGMLASLQSTTYTFTQTLTPPLNDPYTDELCLMVYTVMAGDTVQMNDTAFTSFLSIPAKDLKLQGTVSITERCELRNVQIQTEIKNVGEKIVDATDVVQVSYWIEDRPDIMVTETLTFPYTDITNGTTFQSLQPGASLTYTFNQTANLYPLGDSDVQWKLWTCVKTVGDNQQENDTAASAKTVHSKISPAAPTVTDDHIPYATWGHPSAEQVGNLPIKWYSSATATDPFFTASSYNSSKVYTTTQLFADTTFYVGVNAANAQYPCASERTAVSVYLDPRAGVDASAVAVVEPPVEAWVYMTTGDTIKVELTNFGTQPLTNIPVSYSIKNGTSSTAETIVVSEVCTATIQPDQHYIYSFDSLADMSNTNINYTVRAWTDMPGDYTALNDTTDKVVIKPKKESIYCSVSIGNAESLDISRVQLGTMDHPTTPSGNDYTSYASDTTVTVPVLYKGVPDQMNIYVDNSTPMDPLSVVGGWVKVFIDWDRMGTFDANECVLSDTAYTGSLVTGTINVPANTINGLTKMRVILNQGANSEDEFEPCGNIGRGEIEDYLVFIKTAEDVNAELKRFESPSTLAEGGQTNISVVLRNAGLQPLSTATITWSYNGGTPTQFNWNGNLTSGALETVTLGAIDLDLGMNNLSAYVDVAGDTDHENDTVSVDSYVFRTFTIPYSNNFDQEEDKDHFYAYNASSSNPTNCWQVGTPAETNTTINAAYSEPDCWKTTLDGKPPKNNESILYSPVFDVNIVKPDTMSFMFRRNSGTSANMYIEYLNWEGKWVLLGTYEDPYGENWYNDEENNCFNGNKTWHKVIYSLNHLNYLFGNKLQFRFVFRSSPSAQNDGFAIDDFEIKRAKRDQDAGVVSLTLEPTALPNYGSDYFPKVGIKNFGAQTLTDVQVCYISEGLYIPICENLLNVNIEPDQVYEYTFTTGTYLTVDSPDPFGICAFTRLNPTDVYSDNDSICQDIVIGPLQKDVGIVNINSPTAQIVSNDQIEVAIQIRNYGLDPVSELPVAYTVPGGAQVVETIYFNPPLYNGDEYVYRFNQTFHASFGSVNLKCWTGLDGDYYHDNDTIYKRLEGMGTIKDLEAKYVTIDDADPDNIGLQLAVMNRSSVGIGEITVGYFVNGDRDNMVLETYREGTVLPAGSYGYHKFEATLPRANAPYTRITAFVSVDDENDRTNDTTSVLYMGYRDGVADSILIEQTYESECKVQLTAHNGGTLGGTTQVRAHLVLNGDFANQIVEDFTWTFDEPNPSITRYMNFTQKIPRSESGTYDVLAWIEYPYDADHRNDSTRASAVRSFVGLEDVEAEAGFELEQNQPNPFSDRTVIGFTLPKAGRATLTISNNLGQVLKTIKGVYGSGRSTIILKDLDLPEGVYHYTMYYNDQKQVRKMIIVR